jgi:tellurium resistance protein TerD
MLTSRLLMRLLTLVCTLLQVFHHLTDAGDAQLLGNRRIRSKQVRAAMIFGEIYRNNGEWKFKAVGQGYAGGLAPLARNFGINI